MPKLMISGGNLRTGRTGYHGRPRPGQYHSPRRSFRLGAARGVTRRRKSLSMRDLGSTNGTRVNGSPTGEIILHSGDRIRFRRS